ncbi:MAG: phosphoribosylaminoimidazolesuccinocarboxamide synthase [Candidatus Saccharibacteria bacterium]
MKLHFRKGMIIMGVIERGKLVAKGKTKEIYEAVGRPGLGIFVSKDDLTAGDGAKHDVATGKAALANQTTWSYRQ